MNVKILIPLSILLVGCGSILGGEGRSIVEAQASTDAEVDSMAQAAQPLDYPVAMVSYDDFSQLVGEVEAHRAERLIDLDTLLEMSQDPDTIILDTRSTFRYDRIHLKGARHLSFTDFTQGNLAELIPDPETRILIYCNNNFQGNQVDFASKAFVPTSASDNDVTSQLNAQARPIMLALNVPTYINLYGYGYRNVYELHELVNIDDPRVEFAGTIIDEGRGARAMLEPGQTTGAFRTR
ncbi:MAG: rhodanese-like domain-containing protein [Fimbriimonadaceae bacterium]